MLFAGTLVFGQMINQEGFEGSTFPPPGWFIDGVGGVYPTRVSAPIAGHGLWSVQVPSNAQGVICPKMANPYYLTVYAYKGGTGNCAPQFEYCSTLDGTWLPVAGVNNISHSVWNKIDVTAAIFDAYVRITYKQGGTTTLYIDDITITPLAYNYNFRTTKNGDWGDPSVWEYARVDNPTVWYTANVAPSEANAVGVTIQAAHTVTVAANATTDQTVVDGSLIINSGVTLTVNNGDLTDLAINGTLTNTGTLAFNTGATMTAGASSNLTYNGSSAQALGAGFPSTVNNLTINNSAGVTLSGSCAVNGTFNLTAGNMAIGANTLTANSTAIFGATSYVSGVGSFVLPSGATLQTANTAGIASSGATGSVQTTVRTFNTGANYVFNGSSAQVTGTGLPSTVNNLTINNSAGVTLSGSRQVNGALVLTTGLGIGDSNTLTINGTVSGSGGLTGGANSNLSVTGTGVITLPNVTTLNNLNINRTDTVTLGGSCTVGGALTLNTGLSIGANTLTINGTIPTVTGDIVGGSSSSIIVGGSSPLTLPAITSGLSNFTTNRSGGVTLGSSVAVGGIFTNNATLNVGSFGISGSGAGVNNATIISATPNPITTATFTQGAGSTIEYTSDVTLPSGYAYQNLLLNSASTVFALGGDITVNETFLSSNNASLNLNGFRMFFPFKYVSVAGAVTITAFSPETYVEQPVPGGVARKWTFTGAPSVSPTIYLHWDNAQGDGVNFSSGSKIWKFSGSTWQLIGTAGVPVDDGSGTRMMVSFPSTLGGKADTEGQYAVSGGDDTLPVELSSFTIAMNAYNMVTLQWVTQSETNVSGFRIYRNLEDRLDTATQLSTFIPATNTSQMQVYVFTDEEVTSDGIYYYWLENLDLDGTMETHGPITIQVSLTGQSTPAIPILNGITRTYPNPFNPVVYLACGLKTAGVTTVEVFNQRGQLVKTLFSGNKEKGNFTLQWDGKDNLGHKQPSGIYYVRMDMPGEKSIKKVVLSK